MAGVGFPKPLSGGSQTERRRQVAHWTVEFGFEQFKKHIDTIRAAESSNEATTRMRAIDTVLFEVLGWDKTRVECERFCRASGFADYAFQDGRSPCLILEAKRQGKTFILPGSLSRPTDRLSAAG